MTAFETIRTVTFYSSIMMGIPSLIYQEAEAGLALAGMLKFFSHCTRTGNIIAEHDSHTEPFISKDVF